MNDRAAFVFVFVPLEIPSVANLREHWRARARRAKAQRIAVKAVLAGHDLRLPCSVTLTRCACRKLDDDNAISALKACRDGVADALGVKDDHPDVRWRYRQEKTSTRKNFGLGIVVEFLDTPGIEGYAPPS